MKEEITEVLNTYSCYIDRRTNLGVIPRSEAQGPLLFFPCWRRSTELDPRADPVWEMIASATDKHPRSKARRLKRIVKAGISLKLTETVEPLPSLVIDINSVISRVSQKLVSKNAQ